MNLPLFSAIFTIAFTVVIGVIMVVLFVNNMANAQTILGAVAVGTLISLPTAFGVAKKLTSMTGEPKL